MQGIKSEDQYQVNGIDLTVGKIYLPIDLPFGEKPTEQDYVKMPLILEDEDVEPYWVISKGQPVLVEIAETINLSGDVTKTSNPNDYLGPLIGYAVGRSSLLRIGVLLSGAFWDNSYVGKGKLLVIPMYQDLLLKKGMRFAQIAFWPANTSDKQYNGSYQKEGLKV